MKPTQAAVISILLAATMLLAAAMPCPAAEKMWVSDKLQLTVRTGPSIQNKIIALVNTGEWAEVISEEQDGWAKVRLANGKEGWVISRYLTKERPAMLRLAELSPQATETADKMEAMHQENEELKAKVAQLEAASAALEQVRSRMESTEDVQQQLQNENAALKQSLGEALSQAKTAGQRYEKLAREAGDVVNLQQERDQLNARLAQQQENIGQLQEEVESLRFAGSLKWFLAGAGVLVIGWLMGFALHRRKNRYSSLLD